MESIVLEPMEKPITKLKTILKEHEKDVEMESLTQESVTQKFQYSQQVQRLKEIENPKEKVSGVLLEQEEVVDKLSEIQYENHVATVLAATKCIIKARADEKVSLRVLEEKNALLEQKIATLQKTKGDCNFEGEQVRKKLEHSELDLKILQRNVKHTGEAIDLVKNHFIDVNIACQKTKELAHKVLKAISEARKNFLSVKDQYKKEIEYIKAQIEEEKSHIKTSNLDLLKQELLQYKIKYEEKRQRRESLLEEIRQIIENNKHLSENIERMNGEKEQRKAELSEKQSKLKEVDDKIEENQREFKVQTSRLNSQIEDAQNRCELLKNQVKECKENIAKVIAANAQAEESTNNLKLEVNELENNIKILQEIQSSLEQEYFQAQKIVQEKINKSNKAVQQVERECTEVLEKEKKIRIELETQKSKNSQQAQRLNEIVIKKLEMQNLVQLEQQKLNIKQIELKVLQENYESAKKLHKELQKEDQSLDEQISEEKEKLKKIETGQEDEKTTNEKVLSDLDKKHAYLQSSNSALKTKLDNLKEETMALKNEIKSMQEEIKSKNIEGQLECLTKQLEKKREEYKKKLENTKSTEFKQPASILKSPHKSLAVSPKKVKFEGVRSSSEESLQENTDPEFAKFLQSIEDQVNSELGKRPKKARSLNLDF